jgi:hypothetical protein
VELPKTFLLGARRWGGSTWWAWGVGLVLDLWERLTRSLSLRLALRAGLAACPPHGCTVGDSIHTCPLEGTVSVDVSSRAKRNGGQHHEAAERRHQSEPKPQRLIRKSPPGFLSSLRGCRGAPVHLRSRQSLLIQKSSAPHFEANDIQRLFKSGPFHSPLYLLRNQLTVYAICIKTHALFI